VPAGSPGRSRPDPRPTFLRNRPPGRRSTPAAASCKGLERTQVQASGDGGP
jgi:hypothetical protein